MQVRPVFTLLRALLPAVVLTIGAAAAADPKVTEPNEALKGDTKEVMDLKVTPVKLKANVLGCMCWSDKKAESLWALDSSGIIFKITFPDLKVVQKVELEKKCSWLAPSAEGLVVSVSEDKEVWLLDSDKLAVKKKIPVASLKRASSALNLSTAFASSDKDLYEINLKTGKAEKFGKEGPKNGGYADALVTPNGKFLFTTGSEAMHKYSINKEGKAKFEQSSPRIAQGRVDVGVQVSSDSKYVTLPCYAGNYTAGNYGIYIYPVENVERPDITVAFGGPCGMTLTVDPASGFVYSEGLLLFDKEGKRQKEYKLEAGPMMQLLFHPEGGKALLLGKNKFLLVELPKKEKE